jgi:alkanesulfonate monooxygenase SsuD/methylene tetrahydromethanopterin reductase-like flavin-dependent oxidoreductase (luciferase family)
LKVGTGVLVLPLRRDIVALAKQIATLDHFGGGRLEIGVGIGAYHEEFAAVQPGAAIRRGDIVDEGVAALRLLFSQRVASFAGRFYRFRDVELFPKTRQPRIPIYIGGNNRNNLARTVRWGDGWLPAGIAVDRLKSDVAELHRLAEAAGRDPASIEIAPQFIVHLGPTREAAVTSFRASQMNKHLTSLRQSTLKEQGAASHEEINLIGTPDAVIEKALAFRAAGVTHLLGLYFAAQSVTELLDQMQLFAERVMPALR